MSDPNKPSSSLDDLQRKIDEAKTLHGQKDSGDGNGYAKSHSGVGQAFQVGIELVAGVGVGCFVGYGLDKWLGTMPLFFIVCFLLGAVAGFRNLIRRAQMDTDE